MCGWKRARTPEQIDQRRQQILHAAEELFTSSDYNSVSLNGIARQAGMAKSNIYNYFQTREEIFLTLIQNRMLAWGELITRTLERKKLNKIDDLADILISPEAASEEFLALTAVLSSSLEQNSSEESIVKFKRAAMKVSSELHGIIQTQFPWFTTQMGGELFNLLHTLTAGLYYSARPSPAHEQVLTRPEFAAMKINLRESVSGILKRVLRDMENEVK